ncbi:CRISPR-associated protein Csx3 [Iningainema tapete]|uniref:CRISPR-associated protein Csx3 n=1 Tax=Iningainema tapete BLCC-T55 TaxID=2748662 RepID=A0A8J7C916_9CYAN|nr:CRISPR-associated protein Csx3 [Iningainema tapete]MBD2775411.1 CRISPR-associated protein Csx3 [Iningainema tapete BLCC-T55]
MTTYHINLEDDVLRVKFGTPANGDQIVRDAAARLDELIDSGELSGGSLLKINGRASVLVSQVLAHKLSHLYGAIAFFDPKIGDKGLDRYVITISHNPMYKVGDTLDLTRAQKNLSSVKVVLCGFANTGKSCFREGLKLAILQIPDAPDSYVISGCPDGDGSWYCETARRDPELAQQLKKEYKAKFTPEFAQLKAHEIRVINTPLLVFDVGGKISDENRLIMTEATHAVILANNEQEILTWQEFCKSLNLRVIAKIYSDYKGTADYIEAESPVIKGSVHYLERGEDVSTRPMVQALARLLVDVSKV